VTDKLAYSINEAADRIGVGRTTLYQLVNAGELRLVKLGSRSLIIAAELEALLHRRALQRAA
jgi:excisionase family DNA binding protein